MLPGYQERCSLSEFFSSSTPGRNEPLRRNENHRDEKALTAARCGKGRLHYVFAAICKWHPREMASTQTSSAPEIRHFLG